MFTPRKPVYTYKCPPPARPPPTFPSTVPKGPFTSASSPVRTAQFQSSASTSSSTSRPSSPYKTHPVREIFGDAAFATYCAGLGFPPVPPAAPLFTPAPTPAGTPASSTSPLKAGCRPRPAFDLPPAQVAKLRAARARASARISDSFRNARRLGRSASWLSREERKQNRLRGDSLLGQKRREERKRKALEDECKKRVQEQAQKLAEEMRMRSELDEKRAQEERRRKAVSNLWATYVAQWEHIMNLPADLPEHELLTARNLPCPLAIPPNVVSDMSVITRERIEAFLMDPAHSEGKSRKERVRAALLVWHPDKCEKWICKFREDRRPLIREAVGTIACHLTEMMTA
ncbi:hypothetical protein FRC06_005635 [Ceratobasidium sp. 370]|nr:hypothetical protein FRC06_005635 [Ceratobasidium sp. 370]